MDEAEVKAGHETEPQQPQAEQPAAKALPSTKVMLETTVDGKTESTQITFNTPDMYKRVQALDKSASVKIYVDRDGKQTVLIEGNRDTAAAALKASIIPSKQLMNHLRGFVKAVIDHSTVKAIGVEAVCLDDEGSDAGFGFVVTAKDCTAGQAVSLVNCADANMDEFIAKAKLSVPGRSAPAAGGIVAPTPEQVKELGK